MANNSLTLGVLPNNDPFGSAGAYAVQGRVVAAAGQSVYDLRVQVYHVSDPLVPIATGAIAPSGTFNVPVSRAELRARFGKAAPMFHASVLHAGAEVGTTRATRPWDPQTTLWQIPLKPVTAAPPVLDDGAFRLLVTVIDQDSRPVAGVVVNATTVGTPPPLSDSPPVFGGGGVGSGRPVATVSSTTDANGRATLALHPGTLEVYGAAAIDLEAPGHVGKNTVVAILGQEIATTLEISTVELGSRVARLKAALQQVVGSDSVGHLNPEGATLLAGQLQNSFTADEVASLVEAEKAAVETGASVGFHVALQRAGLHVENTTPDRLLDNVRWTQHAAAALESGVIGEGDLDLEADLLGFNASAIDRVLDVQQLGSLGVFVKYLYDSEAVALRRAFLQDVAASADETEFWANVGTRLGSTAAAERLQRRLTLYRRFAGDDVVLTALDAEYDSAPSDPEQDPPSDEDLAGLSQSDWEGIVEGSSVLEDEQWGATETERRKRYARVLRTTSDRVAPTAAFQRRLSAEASTYFETTPAKTRFESLVSLGFRVEGEPLLAFEAKARAEENTAVLDVLDADSDNETRQGISSLQRLRQVTDDYDELVVLRTADFSSARDIATQSKEEFRASVSPSLDIARADSLHLWARHVHNLVLEALPRIRAEETKGIEEPPPAPPVDEPTGFLGTEAALRSGYSLLQSTVASVNCGHCASIFSPAAYLVDMIGFFQRHKAFPENPASVPPPSKSLYDCLFVGTPARRPDILACPLDCQAVDEPVPYLRIVNDVLAAAQELEPADLPTAFGAHTWPWQLPLSLERHQLRFHLAHARLGRADVIEQLQRVDAELSPAAAHAVACAVLGTHAQDLSDIRGGTVAAFWPPGIITNTNSLPQFRKITGLSDTEVDALVSGTVFGSGANPVVILAPGTGQISPQIGRVVSSSVVAWTDEDKRLIRGFVRLARCTGLSFSDLDAVLGWTGLLGTPPTLTMSEASVHGVAQFVLLSNETGIPLRELASLWSNPWETPPLSTDQALSASWHRIHEILVSETVPAGGAALNRVSAKQWHSLLTRALGVSPADVIAFDAALFPSDELTVNLSEYFARCLQHERVARLFGMSLEEHLRWVGLIGSPPFPGSAELAEQDVVVSIRETRRYIERVRNLRVRDEVTINDVAVLFATSEANFDSAAITQAILTWFSQDLTELAAVDGEPDFDTAPFVARFVQRVGAAMGGFALGDVVDLIVFSYPENANITLSAWIETQVETQVETQAEEAVEAAVAALARTLARVQRAAALLGVTGTELAALDAWNTVHSLTLPLLKMPTSFVGEGSRIERLFMLARLRDLWANRQTPVPYLIAAQPTSFFAWALQNRANTSAWATAFGVASAVLDTLSGDTFTDATSAIQMEVIARLCALEDWSRMAKLPLADVVAHWGVLDERTVHESETTHAGRMIQHLESRASVGQWAKSTAEIEDRMLAIRRDALVARRIATDGDSTPALGLANHPDALTRLYDHYLLDPRMSARAQTTRVLDAVSALQLFLQRCLLGEEQYPSTGASLGRIVLAPATRQEWDWLRRYRLWEANRKVFIYPENWMVPELRDDKTELFVQFEQQLKQSDLNPEQIETALRNYLDSLQRIARLRPVAVYTERLRPDSVSREAQASDLPPATVHVVARTRESGREFFHAYRRPTATGGPGRWTAWRRVPAATNSSLITLCRVGRRLMLFWVAVTRSGDPSAQIPSAAEVESGSAAFAILSCRFEFRLHWCEFGAAGWSTAKTADDPITYLAFGSASDFDNVERKVAVVHRESPDDPNVVDLAVVIRTSSGLGSPPKFPSLGAFQWRAESRTAVPIFTRHEWVQVAAGGQRGSLHYHGQEVRLDQSERDLPPSSVLFSAPLDLGVRSGGTSTSWSAINTDAKTLFSRRATYLSALFDAAHAFPVPGLPFTVDDTSSGACFLVTPQTLSVLSDLWAFPGADSVELAPWLLDISSGSVGALRFGESQLDTMVRRVTAGSVPASYASAIGGLADDFLRTSVDQLPANGTTLPPQDRWLTGTAGGLNRGRTGFP